jgi:hypothetical protein
VNLEEKIYRGAITLSELGLGTFDECVDACRKARGDLDYAAQLVVENKK